MKIDTYLHLKTQTAGKLKGESIANGHQDDIIVRSWSWGVLAQTAMGQVQSTARHSYKNLTFTKWADTASTGLLSALHNNSVVTEAKLTMRKAGQGQQDFYSLTITKGRIISVDIVTDEEGNVIEHIGLSYAEVKIEYTPQLASGGRGNSCTFNATV